MPGKRTVFRWLSGNPEFRHQYAQARESQAEAIADEILEISDDGTNDTQVDENGFERVNHDHIARSKLRVDSRKWLLSKLAPKKYGDQLGVTHVGELDIRVVIGGDAPPSQGMEGS